MMKSAQDWSRDDLTSRRRRPLLRRSNAGALIAHGGKKAEFYSNKLLPEQPWKGNHSLRVIGNALGKAIGYCHRHGLPILSPLVVNASTGRLTDAAVANIARECRELGMDTGPSDHAFVERQAAEARIVSIDRLPPEQPV